MSNKPGVYVEERIAVPEEAPVTELAVLGIVGMAQRGPTERPQRLTSWRQYSEVFGGFIGHGFMAHAVYAFFRNGGRVCWAQRVTAAEDRAAELDLDRLTGGALPFRIVASSPGEWGNAVEVEAHAVSDRKIELGRIQREEPLSEAIARLGGPLNGLVHIRDRAAPVHHGVKVERGACRDGAPSHRFHGDARLLGKGFKLVFRYEGRGETFDGLSTDPNHPRYACRIINGPALYLDPLKRLQEGYSTLVRVEPTRAWNGNPYIPKNRVWRGFLEKGRERGAPMRRASDYTGYAGSDPISMRGSSDKTPRGLAALEAVAEIELAALPDLTLIGQPLRDQAGARLGPVWRGELPVRGDSEPYETGLRHLVFHCERATPRFALLDPPRPAGADRGIGDVTAIAQNFHLYPGSRNAAIYHPWVRLPLPGRGGAAIWLPPSGHVAGIYSRAYQERGLGAAPANYPLAEALAMYAGLSRAEQGRLNARGINCLDCAPGKGVRVWGARTLWYGASTNDITWTYISVRLLYLRLMRFIRDTLTPAAFEPNDAELWDEIAATLSLFLDELFHTGALAGQSESEAYFVKCDEETNPPESVAAGKVAALLGFAPVRPAEFIYIRVTRTESGVDFREEAGPRPAEA